MREQSHRDKCDGDSQEIEMRADTLTRVECDWERERERGKVGGYETEKMRKHFVTRAITDNLGSFLSFLLCRE